MNILFVCTGNTCRSPMAAAFLRHLAAQEGVSWTVDSAGLYALDGQPMTRHAVDALIRRHVVAPTHAAKRLTRELLLLADVVLVMTHGHLQALRDMFPEVAHKVYTLTAFAHRQAEEQAGDVMDPFGGDEHAYEACADSLFALVEKAFLRLREEASRDGGSNQAN
ncbi:low molecular weight protein arginine phosphatase [Alicyclobacillus hesperidum]|uniref:low molecular weight protein arginine phosphatase n=1 Tax=Alicyclobacillus hesperidum TaxID=89784 RepID=UPI0002F3E6D5|nr:low molecular weight protein arginine phosphatase [Alicyclobacillus hesperidum]